MWFLLSFRTALHSLKLEEEDERIRREEEEANRAKQEEEAGKAAKKAEKKAKEAGILVDMANVPAQKSIDLINGGFTGANLKLMGNLLAARAVKDFGLKKGDGAIVVGTFGVPGRSDREDGTVATLEKAGVKVTKLNLTPLGDIDSRIQKAIFFASFRANNESKYSSRCPTLMS